HPKVISQPRVNRNLRLLQPKLQRARLEVRFSFVSKLTSNRLKTLLHCFIFVNKKKRHIKLDMPVTF
ncbi:MAG: hypothetical protein WBO92_05025, partial [Candidatus Moraniibacteriota bacterium]